MEDNMNLKHISIIFLALCVLLVSVSAISANENLTKDVVGDTNDASLKEAIDEKVLANSSSTTPKSNSTAETAKNTTTDTAKKTTKLKVTAPIVFNSFKKKGTFKITVKDQDKKPIKKLKLKVKVYTGKKFKTYTIKTNSKGVATLNTKTLKKGTHKVVISSGDKNYTISKKSYIHIGVKKSLYLRIGKSKNFKNGDYFRFFKETKNAQYNKGVYVENLRIYKGGLYPAKSHHILKVKYTFKNIMGNTIIKTSTSNNMFQTKLIIGYEPVLAKIWYLEE